MSTTDFPGILWLEFDETGVNPDNLCTNEVVALPTNPTGIRAFVLPHGAFYVNSLVLKDALGNTLTPWVDYAPTHAYPQVRVNSGLDNAALVIVKNATLAGNLVATYQACGYPFGLSNQDLLDVLAALEAYHPTYYYNDIENKPLAFPPSPHTLDMKDTYNWIPATDALYRFKDVLDNVNRLPSLQDLVDQLDSRIASARSSFDALSAGLLAHARLVNNPHNDTKNTVVGLEQVDDFALGSVQDALNGTASNLFMSPLTASQAALATLMANDSTVVHIGKVPMLQFGDLSANPIPYTVSGFVLNLTQAVPAIFADREFTLPISVVNLGTWVANPANATLYLYVRVRNGQASYEIQTLTTPETTTYINVGVLVTNATTITSVTLNKFCGLGTVRVSESKIGSAISATPGLPSQPAYLNY